MDFQTQEAIDYFKFRFPELAGRGDGIINLILTEATAEVGDNWSVRDRTSATMYLAAHMLSTQGTDAVTMGQVKRDKVGDSETEFAGAGTAVGYGSTVYGREFQKLLRRNFPAVLVV